MAKRVSQRRVGVALFLVAMAMILLIPTAFAAGGPPAGRGGGRGGGGSHGHGGGPPAAEVSNNLSVPAILIGTGYPTLNFACGAAVDPTGAPDTGFEVSGYYYVQGTHKWQASCTTATSATTDLYWGDNLAGGSASLRVGTPIRVEVGLYDIQTDATTRNMTGYTTIKLQPSLLDRESKYGTLASGPEVDSPPAAKLTPFTSGTLTEVRVWAANSTLKIYNKSSGAVVFQGPATAEINASGRIVYGYNLTVPAGSPAGTYVIEFTAGPGVTLNSVNAGTWSGNVATLEINLTA